jgi:hypothetical protein
LAACNKLSILRSAIFGIASITDLSCPGIALVNEPAKFVTPDVAAVFYLSNEAPADCNPETTPELLIAFLTVEVAVVAADVISNAIN